MALKNKIVISLIALGIFVFLWNIFFTYGFDFFWEDFHVFNLDKNGPATFQVFKEGYIDETINTSRFSLFPGILRGFIKEFFRTYRLFQVGYNSFSFVDRPYQFLTWDLMKLFFNDNVILYRILKAIIFAINACLVFVIINKKSRLLAFLGVFLFISSSELWLSTVSLTDVTLFAHCGTLLSIMLFLELLEKHPLSYKDTLFYYSLIIPASIYPILMSSSGRYFAVIFFLTIFFFRRKDIRFHAPMLLILLLMELPILGIIRKFFFQLSFSPINLSGRIGTSTSSLESFKTAVSNYRFPLNAIGWLPLVIFFIAIIWHLVCLLLRENSSIKENDRELLLIEKGELFLLVLWFLASFVMVARARSFHYDGTLSFQLADLMHIVAPFIIFLCYYITILQNIFKKPYRLVMLIVSVSLMTAQILFIQLPRLNSFRGGWGNYFIGWQNAKKYIDTISDNALVLVITKMPYVPFVFQRSNNECIISIAVTKEYFSKIIPDYEGLLVHFIKNGYIDENGIIQNKFRKLKNASELVVPETFKDKLPALFEAFQNASILSAEKSSFCDIAYIKDKFTKGGYSDIFVVAKGELTFRHESKSVILKEVKIIDGDSSDLYDILKRFIGRPSKPLIYVYRFISLYTKHSLGIEK